MNWIRLAASSALTEADEQHSMAVSVAVLWNSFLPCIHCPSARCATWFCGCLAGLWHGRVCRSLPRPAVPWRLEVGQARPRAAPTWPCAARPRKVECKSGPSASSCADWPARHVWRLRTPRTCPDSKDAAAACGRHGLTWDSGGRSHRAMHFGTRVHSVCILAASGVIEGAPAGGVRCGLR